MELSNMPEFRYQPIFELGSDETPTVDYRSMTAWRRRASMDGSS